MANTEKTYALILGIVALLVGILGLIQGNLILGIFGVNTLQTIVHLLVGVMGIYAGTMGEGDVFTKWLGWGSLVLGVVGFFGILDTLLNVNTAVNILHVVVGLVSLVVSYSASK